MKRTIGFAFLVIACIAGFLSIKGAMPFMPIYGSSMEPTLQSGSLMIIEPIDPQELEVGDIIVYNVPSMVREYYNYPAVVAHRVKDIRTTPSLGFRTHGDNTGEDPFTIRPQDIRGTVGSQIPFMGIPLLFFQSQQGLIFTIIALLLLAFFLYGGEISQGGRFMHRSIFAPVINEEKRTNRVLTRKIEATEQKMSSTENALEKFSLAVSEYAQHLASHTSAIQGLAEASHELKRGAAEQNRVLAHLMENMAQPGALRMVRPQTAAEPEPLHAIAPMPEPEAATVPTDVSQKKSPPGCARKRPLSTEEILNELKKVV
jgi:signal peptidase I